MLIEKISICIIVHVHLEKSTSPKAGTGEEFVHGDRVVVVVTSESFVHSHIHFVSFLPDLEGVINKINGVHI